MSARIWRPFRAMGFEFLPRWEHFGDPSASGDLFLTFEVPDDDPLPAESCRAYAVGICARVAGNYKTASEAGKALARERRAALATAKGE